MEEVLILIHVLNLIIIGMCALLQAYGGDVAQAFYGYLAVTCVIILFQLLKPRRKIK
jgi:hypothetical protein